MKKRLLEKKYYNLNYSSSARGPWILAHPKIVLVTLVLIVVGMVYLIYGLPVWQLKSLKVSGSYDFSAEELKQITLRQMNARWLLFFKQNKLWTFDINAYQKKLKERWIFSKLEVSKIIPGTIVLKLIEQKPDFILRINDSIIGIDSAGVASNILTNESVASTIQLDFETPLQAMSLGQKIVSADDMNFLKKFVDEIKKMNEKKLTINSILLKNPPNRTAAIRLVGDSEIRFDLSSPVDRQIDAFVLAYNQKLKNKKFSYIDVTVPSRVYYK